MAELKHTCANNDGLADVGHAPEQCLRCDLTALLKTVATSKRGGAMNIGDGSELDRIEEALARVAELEQAHAEQVAERERLLADIADFVLDHGCIGNHGHRKPTTACAECQVVNRLEAERARQAKGVKP